MAAATDTIIAFLDELLRPADFDDYCPNGLQVPGPEQVGTVVTAVSAGAGLFERAAAEGADLVLVHHGLFWDGAPRALDAHSKRRLKLLFDHDIALAAYHLPLDAHPEHGNNALLAQAIGALPTAPFEVGFEAAFDGDGVEPAELVRRVAEAVGGREPLALLHGPARVRTIGIVSGAAQGLLPRAIAAGLDAYLTGEASERNLNEAGEGGIHFLAGGHYATETLGVRRLGELLEARLGVRHVFVDLPNPI
ncbi:MAG TPA: Nif3-like dinuclear metal center hexameric protein [Solirubrobacteraceae bacterium]|nr:Nif3-like dinuclear metal center hexameric protein [Solirubrobacteraceae bacterium]